MSFKATLLEVLQAAGTYLIDGLDGEKLDLGEGIYSFDMDDGSDTTFELKLNVNQEVVVDKHGKCTVADVDGYPHQLHLWSCSPLTAEDVRRWRESNHLPG